MVCRAPLLQGGLCRRKDPSGRCPIHGTIILRHGSTGAPMHKGDAMKLHAEWSEHYKVKQMKTNQIQGKQRRRRYPGLVDIKSVKSSARHKLARRVFGRCAIKKSFGDG
ncbi:unnamed protein product [Protopolystoma xenopodis]|uniref:UV-stimulated scaffold protein A C-terminal domain-containing protein n=1 Tax=Protopolystoma xenopodis TaxID=117903 RepID=A0A448WA65_9PLAT|nr:unnamed protein product [Protopolystoma xenopodis]